MHVILNGYGVPAGSVSGRDRYYVSIQNNNQGRTLSTKSYWLPLNDTTPTIWNSTDHYEAGSLVVNTIGILFIALYDNVASEPATDEGIGDWYEYGVFGDPTNPIPFTTIDSLFVDRGRFNANTIYARGDRVLGGRYANSAGFRRVEKYPEANFLRLRIPTSLYSFW